MFIIISSWNVEENWKKKQLTLTPDWFYDIELKCHYQLTLTLHWFSDFNLKWGGKLVDFDSAWFYDFKLKCWEKLVDLEPDSFHDFKLNCGERLKIFKIDPSTFDFDLVLVFMILSWNVQRKLKKVDFNLGLFLWSFIKILSSVDFLHCC